MPGGRRDSRGAACGLGGSLVRLCRKICAPLSIFKHGFVIIFLKIAVNPPSSLWERKARYSCL